MRFSEFNKPLKECTTSGAIAVAMPGGGNGFANGGPGMISRKPRKTKKAKK